MNPKICVSILPQTVDEALRLIDKAENHNPNFIEVRLDRIKEISRLAEVTGCTKTPLIATNRAGSCGGMFAGSEVERQRSLLKAAEEGFQYVDIEVSTVWLEQTIFILRQIGVKPIVSFHDFERTPSVLKLQEILRREIESDAEICKIVTTALTMDDNLTLLGFTRKASEDVKLVCFGMGVLGKLSRVLSPFFGAFYTVAALEHGKETALGQMSIQELKTIYNILEVFH